MSSSSFGAIAATQGSMGTYVKFLSANDTGQTGGHQSGVLIGRCALGMTFDGHPREHIAKRERVRVTWQGELATDSCITWYESKGELRLTRMGRGFPYLHPDRTGSLLVLSKARDDEYSAWILDTEDEIETYLATFGMGVQDANSMVRLPGAAPAPSLGEETSAIMEYVSSLGVTDSSGFPETDEVSAKAREVQELVHDHSELLVSNPDLKLVEYRRVEFEIFRKIEDAAYGETVARGWDDIDEFVAYAHKVINRRMSRGGRSLENHLEAIFRANGLDFTPQAQTEGKKTPDFVFPSEAAYHDLSFPADRLVVLAAKTTCKDRWRQVLSEADRVKGGPHYLVTLQQGISETQLDEMGADNVQLVVPRQYIKDYPASRRRTIWTLKDFIGFVRGRAA